MIPGGRSTAIDFEVTAAGDAVLRGTRSGAASRAALLLHGLTANRRLVAMGSRTLERSGIETVAYDARGHGASSTSAAGGGWGYSELAGDAETVIEETCGAPVLGIGVSMGAHTAVSLALRRPELFTGLVLVTPGFDPDAVAGEGGGPDWSRLADALESNGIEGFISVLAELPVDDAFRDSDLTAMRQRMSAHRDPGAVATALRSVPVSRPFEAWTDLAELGLPTVVIGSRDEADPIHPERIARRWADGIPGAGYEIEPRGESPLAWRGGRICAIALELAERASAAG